MASFASRYAGLLEDQRPVLCQVGPGTCAHEEKRDARENVAHGGSIPALPERCFAR